VEGVCQLRYTRARTIIFVNKLVRKLLSVCLVVMSQKSFLRNCSCRINNKFTRLLQYQVHKSSPVAFKDFDLLVSKINKTWEETLINGKLSYIACEISKMYLLEFSTKLC